MDKNILKICFVAALLVSAGTAYAATDITGATQIGGGTTVPKFEVNLIKILGQDRWQALSMKSLDCLPGTSQLVPDSVR